MKFYMSAHTHDKYHHSHIQVLSGCSQCASQTFLGSEAHRMESIPRSSWVLICFLPANDFTKYAEIKQGFKDNTFGVTES